jgi:hypothetical protein
MGYRDPREALHAENESLRQQLKEKERELDELRGQQDYEPSAPSRRAAVRWGVGFASIGAILPPMMLMLAATHGAWVAQARYHGMSPARMMPVVHGCPMAHAAMGFERFTQAVERSGRVIETQNIAGVSPGARCTVRVAPVSMVDFNCHVDVVCGDVVMYGTQPTGYAHCDVDGPVPVRAFDGEVTAGDGDPAVSLDLTAGQMLFLDRNGNTPMRAVLALDAPSSGLPAATTTAAVSSPAVYPELSTTIPVDALPARGGSDGTVVYPELSTTIPVDVIEP